MTAQTKPHLAIVVRCGHWTPLLDRTLQYATESGDEVLVSTVAESSMLTSTARRFSVPLVSDSIGETIQQTHTRIESKLSADWILWLDVGDKLSREHMADLRELTQTNPMNLPHAYRVSIKWPGYGEHEHVDATSRDELRLYQRSSPIAQRGGWLADEVAVDLAPGQLAWSHIEIFRPAQRRREPKCMVFRYADSTHHELLQEGRLEASNDLLGTCIDYFRGILAVSAGKYDEVSRDWQHLISLGNRHPYGKSVFGLLIRHAIHDRAFKTAESLCDSAKSYYASDAELLLSEGLLWHRRGQLEKAIGAYVEAEKCHPQRGCCVHYHRIPAYFARYCRANALAEIGQGQRAEELWMEVTQIAPLFVPAYVRLVHLRVERGDHASANALLAEMGQRRELLACKHVLSASVNSQTTKWEDVASQLEYAARTWPAEGMAGREMVSQFVRQGKFDEIEALARHMVEHFPGDPEAWYMVGYGYHRLGKYHEAVNSLERAVALEPDYRQARLALAESLTSIAAFDEAANTMSVADGICGAFPETRIPLSLSE